MCSSWYFIAFCDIGDFEDDDDSGKGLSLVEALGDCNHAGQKSLIKGAPMLD